MDAGRRQFRSVDDLSRDGGATRLDHRRAASPPLPITPFVDPALQRDSKIQQKITAHSITVLCFLPRLHIAKCIGCTWIIARSE